MYQSSEIGLSSELSSTRDESLVLAARQLWNAKWLLGGLFIVSLFVAYGLSLLVPDKFGSVATYLPPDDGKAYALLSAPMLDQRGNVLFEMSSDELFERFLVAAQSSIVTKKLYEEYKTKIGDSKALSYLMFIDSLKLTLPISGKSAKIQDSEIFKISAFSSDREVALWLAERYQSLIEEVAISNLHFEFEALKGKVASNLAAQLDRLRNDYNVEAEQRLAELRDRKELLESVIELRLAGSPNQAVPELSIALDGGLPIYLLPDTNLLSALDVVTRQISQIEARDNPDLYIENIASVLSQQKAVQGIELNVDPSSFYTLVIPPEIDDALTSPKRWLLSFVCSLVFTIIGMLVVLLAPILRSE